LKLKLKSKSGKIFPLDLHSLTFFPCCVAGGPPGTVVNQNVEIYEPPYLFEANGVRATRPVITNMQDGVQFDETVQVGFANATKIRRVRLIRLGSVTHSFNMDERMLRLRFTQTRGSSSLEVKFPSGPATTPPGYYMVFLVNNLGVPSEAKIVNLSTTPSAS
jgi:hypothetical protein